VHAKCNPLKLLLVIIMKVAMALFVPHEMSTEAHDVRRWKDVV
jgi:hypothetical protein